MRLRVVGCHRPTDGVACPPPTRASKFVVLVARDAGGETGSLPCAEPRRFGQALTDRSSLAPAPATRRPRRPHAGAAAAVAAECRRQGVRREGLPHQDGDHVSARDQGSCSAARPSEARGFARADAATCGRRAVARADALLAAASKSAAARTSLRRFRRRGASAASIACACLLAPRHCTFLRHKLSYV